MSDFTHSQRAIVAAMFARINMGQRPEEKSRLQRLFTCSNIGVATATAALCGEFMETSTDERVWIMEARRWLHDTDLKSLETVRAVWPDIAARIEAALPSDEI